MQCGEAPAAGSPRIVDPRLDASSRRIDVIDGSLSIVEAQADDGQGALPMAVRQVLGVVAADFLGIHQAR